MKNNNLDYRMSKTAFNEYLKTRKGDEKKMNPYTYVIKVINDTFGLKGTVTHLVID